MRSYFELDEKKVSALTLGLMTNLSKVDERKKLQLYKSAFNQGINSFDSAANYQDGYSDIFLGKLIKEFGRENLFVTNKVYFENGYSCFKAGLSKKHIIQTVDGSLKAMKTSYIDCLILHRFDVDTPIEESLGAIELLYREGKIRSWGVSAFSIEQLLDYYHCSQKFRICGLKIVQYAYNLFNRSIEKELNSILCNKEIVVFAYYPLAQGVLTGKYSKGIKEGRARDAFFKKYMWDLTDEKIKLVHNLYRFCSLEKIDLVGLAYSWCLMNRNVVSLITNVRNKQQLSQNITYYNSLCNSEIRITLDFLFNNKPINQYTGQYYEINQRKL